MNNKPPTISNEDYLFVCEFVRRHSSIVLDAGKEYLVESRLEPVIQRNGMVSLNILVQHLRTHSFNEVHKQVIEAMTTNETFFFRDLHPFETLRTEVFPKLIEANKIKKTISIWSAAASSGQEIYSIAMLLRENFPETKDWALNLLATDINTEILNRAKLGIYNQLAVSRGLPAHYLVKYFKQKGSDWEIHEDIRRQVSFAEINLAETWPPLACMDIVFLRNVLIYFDVETKKNILKKNISVMKPNGLLFLGGAETTLNLSDDYIPVQLGKTICYKVRGS